MAGREVQHEPWLRSQPVADFLTVLRPSMIAHERHGLERDRHFSVQVRQAGEERPRPLARRALARALACARVEGGQEGQRPSAPILMLHPMGESRVGRSRRMEAWARLPGSFLLDAADSRIIMYVPRVQSDNVRDTRRELRIPRRVWREPEMRAPGLELVRGEATTDGCRGDGRDEALAFQWLGEFTTVPWGARPPELLRSLAGQLDQMPRHRGGKRPAGDHGQA
jgi:hypothetical protein